MKNLILRTLTGAAFVAAIVAALTVHPFAFLGLFAVVVGLALWEFFGLTERIGLRPEDASPVPRTADRLWGIAGGIYLFSATFLYAGGFASAVVYAPYLAFLIGGLVAGLYHKGGNPITRWAAHLPQSLRAAHLRPHLAERHGSLPCWFDHRSAPTLPAHLAG